MLLSFLGICRLPRNAARLLTGSPGAAGHRMWPPKFARHDERLAYRIDQGEWLKDGRYGVVMQMNGRPHGVALAKTIVDPSVDVGENVVDRLRRDAENKGYL